MDVVENESAQSKHEHLAWTPVNTQFNVEGRMF